MYKIHQQVKARSDIKKIWKYSYDNFGVDQADKYFEELDSGMKKIHIVRVLHDTMQASKHL